MNMNLKHTELERIVDTLPVGIMVFDRKMRLRLWNDQALELTGIGIEDVLSGDYSYLLNEEVREMFDDTWGIGSSSYQRKLVEQGGKTIGYTIRNNRKNEEDDGILIIEDATKFMEIERIKRDFIGTLLHKLRGPLSTLKTSLAMLRSGAVEGIASDAGEIIDMGYHEVNRLATLVGDMRDLFMIETGLAGKDMDIEEFSLSSALSRAVEELAKMAPPFNAVQRRLVRQGSFNVKVKNDFETIKKIFRILIKNALMYSHEETEVTIECEERGNGVEVNIKDRGIGVMEKNTPLLFSKYFREDNRFTREREGNGLGLFIAKSFIELMKGTIYCESVQGKGSVFTFALPREVAAGQCV